MALVMAAPIARSVEPSRHATLDLLKWVAVVVMTLDHLFGALPASWQDYAWPLKVLGRLAFPFFALAMAVNLVRARPGDLAGAGSYFVGLGLFAVISESPHSLYDGPWLNILVTLAAGMPIALAAHHRTLFTTLVGMLALVVALAFRTSEGWHGCQLMYGLPGVLLPAVFVLVLRAPDQQARLLLLSIACILPLAGNISADAIRLLIMDELPLRGHVALIAAFAAPALGYALLQLRLRRTIWPVGSWLYAYYPLHMIPLIVLGDLIT
jgi:hypothetical protein